MPKIEQRILFIALLLALLLAIFWPALPVHSTNTSETPPDQPAQRGSVTTSGETIVIVNGWLIDGTGAAPIPDGVVVVEDKRIVAAGLAAQINIPANAQVLDPLGHDYARHHQRPCS